MKLNNWANELRALSLAPPRTSQLLFGRKIPATPELDICHAHVRLRLHLSTLIKNNY